MRSARPPHGALAAACLASACGGAGPAEEPSRPSYDPRFFAARVVSFEPGDGAGFGQDRLPDVVLGPPYGKGPGAGSLDVLSLGRAGVIVLELGSEAVDGPGVDLLVFENAFHGPDGRLFAETGIVGASPDGVTFVDWPCDADDPSGLFAGCAGVQPVGSMPDDGIGPTDPAAAGGDGFDLSAIGLASARFVRIRDSGLNLSIAPGGGFDLDAVSIVHRAVTP